MDSCYRFLMLSIPWTQLMPSRDVNAATRLAEACWRRDKSLRWHNPNYCDSASVVYETSPFKSAHCI